MWVGPDEGKKRLNFEKDAYHTPDITSPFQLFTVPFNDFDHVHLLFHHKGQNVKAVDGWNYNIGTLVSLGGGLSSTRAFYLFL